MRIARSIAVFLLALGLAAEIGNTGERQTGHAGTRSIDRKSEVRIGTTRVHAEKPSPRHPEGQPQVVEPLTVFRAVEMGLRSGNPSAFEGYLARGRVRLDLAEGGPRGGLFTKGQAYYLLADYLKQTQTLQLDFTRISQAGRDRTNPCAILERTFKTRVGTISRQSIFVSLCLEDSAWVVSEIRVMPAR